MSRFVKYLYLLLSILFLIYLALPNQNFPEYSGKSLQSKEPADVESNLRRGYYNNETRQEVISYYRNRFDELEIFGIKIKYFSLRLNYPPEESQTIIRDQTRSTYLEEIVHPFRESLFINGFEPKRDNDKIVVDGMNFDQKIIIKLVYSSIISRLVIGSVTLVFLYLNILLWGRLLGDFRYTYYEK